MPFFLFRADRPPFESMAQTHSHSFHYSPRWKTSATQPHTRDISASPPPAASSPVHARTTTTTRRLPPAHYCYCCSCQSQTDREKSETPVFDPASGRQGRDSRIDLALCRGIRLVRDGSRALAGLCCGHRRGRRRVVARLSF